MKRNDELTDRDIEQVGGGTIGRKKPAEKKTCDTIEACPQCGYYDGKDKFEA